MRDEKASFDKIDLKYFYADYRGVTAKETIAKDECVIYVPIKRMITLSMARKGEIGKKLMDQKVSLVYPNNSFLSTYVLSEKSNPKTEWTMLFDAMPKSVSNFPIFFTEEEKKLLAGSPFLRMLP